MGENNFYYPEIDEKSLKLMLEIAVDNPSYLDDPDCPYDPELIVLLKSISGQNDVGETDPQSVDLEADALRLFNELKEHKDKLTVEDHAELMAYFRTSTSLLEKLVSLRERANNVKAVSMFMNTIMNVLDEFLEPGQINKVRDRLKEISK